MPSLVGSEMCIRDRWRGHPGCLPAPAGWLVFILIWCQPSHSRRPPGRNPRPGAFPPRPAPACLSLMDTANRRDVRRRRRRRRCRGDIINQCSRATRDIPLPVLSQSGCHVTSESCTPQQVVKMEHVHELTSTRLFPHFLFTNFTLYMERLQICVLSS